MANHVHTFAGNPLDRAESIRRDENAIQALVQAQESVFLTFHKLKVAMDADHNLAWQRQEELSALSEHIVADPILLGIRDNVAHFAANIDAPADTDQYIDCRAAAALLSGPDAGIVAHARAQLDWHRRNNFCAQCGAPSVPERGGQIRRCTRCGKHIFPRTDPVAIMLIIDAPGGDRCLLGQSQGVMANTQFYSALAGFLDQGESLEDAVRREVWEEAGIRVGDVHYHSSQPWPFPSQLMIGCHGVAETLDIQIDPTEMADVRWFSREDALRAVNKAHRHLRVPGEMAIAHHLIRSWAEEEVRL
ncbi:MAG: NAD(+) diphosphatase [bacterium]